MTVEVDLNKPTKFEDYERGDIVKFTEHSKNHGRTAGVLGMQEGHLVVQG